MGQRRFDLRMIWAIEGLGGLGGLGKAVQGRGKTPSSVVDHAQSVEDGVVMRGVRAQFLSEQDKGPLQLFLRLLQPAQPLA